MKGSEEVYPFLLYPLHGSDVDTAEVWFLECPSSGLAFGHSNSYASRVDTAEERTDPNDDWSR